MKLKPVTLASLMAVAGGAAHAAVVSVPAGNITSNTTWVSTNTYVLEGLVYVTDGATLDIEPGTIIRGQPETAPLAGNPGTLIVTRTGKIQARGTSAQPIIFTTAVLDAGLKANGARNGLRHDGDTNGTPDRWTEADGETKWLDLTPATAPLPILNSLGQRNSALTGGVIVLGNASTNCNADVNGDSVPDAGQGFIEGLNSSSLNIYGGNNDQDSSGLIKYLSIRHSGYNLSQAREVNGLTLGGVGSGTTIDHVDIYACSDDGVEVFGGTVNLSYISVIAAEDDGFDADQGHRGTVQFLYVAHGLVTTGLSGDPRGMELDGDDSNDATGNGVTSSGEPRQDTRIYNATIQTNGQIGVVMRRGFGGVIANSIVHNGGAATSLGLDFNSNFGATASINVQQRYADQDLQVRNVTINGFTAATNNWTATPAGGVSTNFNPGSNTGLTANVFYPATLNRTISADMLPISLANGGLNPRPGAGPASGTPSSLATESAQTAAYVPSPVVTTAYKGAFERTASTLWTFGWTAANKTNVDGVKLLVD